MASKNSNLIIVHSVVRIGPGFQQSNIFKGSRLGLQESNTFLRSWQGESGVQSCDLDGVGSIPVMPRRRSPALLIISTNKIGCLFFKERGQGLKFEYISMVRGWSINSRIYFYNL